MPQLKDVSQIRLLFGIRQSFLPRFHIFYSLLPLSRGYLLPKMKITKRRCISHHRLSCRDFIALNENIYFVLKSGPPWFAQLFRAVFSDPAPYLQIKRYLRTRLGRRGHCRMKHQLLDTFFPPHISWSHRHTQLQGGRKVNPVKCLERGVLEIVVNRTNGPHSQSLVL